MELNTMRASNSVVTGRKKSVASNDLFDKCRSFTRPGDLQAAGLYMYFEVFGDREGCGPGEVRMGSRKVLMFGSNDYLDLITHPKVKEAAVQAIKKYGSGCSGSRLLNGTLDMHVRLESELAAFVHKDAAMIFGTGFQANYATLSALTEKGDVMICDHNLHASLVEGALRSPARVMRATSGITRLAAYSSGTNSSATILMILISGLIAGPAVSLYGSPTVSPVTAALWASEPLPP